MEEKTGKWKRSNRIKKSARGRLQGQGAERRQTCPMPIEIETGEEDEGVVPPVAPMKRTHGCVVTIVPNGILL